MTGIRQLSLMTLAVNFLRSYKVLRQLGHGSFARCKQSMAITYTLCKVHPLLLVNNCCILWQHNDKYQPSIVASPRMQGKQAARLL